jgi:hypothetical protein
MAPVPTNIGGDIVNLLGFWSRETWTTLLVVSLTFSCVVSLTVGFTGLKTKVGERIWTALFIAGAAVGAITILALYPPFLGHQPGFKGALEELWAFTRPMLALVSFFFTVVLAAVIGSALRKAVRKARQL